MEKLMNSIKSMSLVKKILLGLLVAALILAAVSCSNSRKEAENAAANAYIVTKPEKRTIEKTLAGSGTLQPANSYTVTTLVEGEIKSADFQEGDIVEKDRVLYEIDRSDASSSFERAQIAYDQTKRAYDDMVDSRYIKSDVAGQLVSLDVVEGDLVNAGQVIGAVRNTSVMTLKVPFSSDDAQSFTIGQSAEVMLDGSFETLEGQVSAISGADIYGVGNMLTRNVTVEVHNPGALSNTQAATATINGIGSSASANFSYKAESALVAMASGEVTKINVPEGGQVSKKQTVVTLGGEDIDDMLKKADESLRSAQLNLDSAQDIMDNYTIKSPISGTIVDKQYEEGEKVSAGRTVCIIYDLSYLEMTLNVDELDISDLAVGQSVAVYADAIEDRSYDGVVTKVSVAGTTYNGTTSYPVTMRIDNIEGLLPGMNADADILLSYAEDVLSVPSSAVTRGDVVLVSKDSPSAVNAVEDLQSPEGYVYVKVETGISDDDYVEILSGITEEDTIEYIEVNSRGNSWINMMYMGGSGGLGGGVPEGQPGGRK